MPEFRIVMRGNQIVCAAACRNPDTRELMDHAAGAGTIGFDCLSDKASDVCAVSVR